MAEEDLLKKMEEQNAMLKEMYRITKQTRNYFRLTLIISVVVIVLPFIGLLFILPSFISSLGAGITGL